MMDPRATHSNHLRQTSHSNSEHTHGSSSHWAAPNHSNSLPQSPWQIYPAAEMPPIAHPTFDNQAPHSPFNFGQHHLPPAGLNERRAAQFEPFLDPFITSVPWPSFMPLTSQGPMVNTADAPLHFSGNFSHSMVTGGSSRASEFDTLTQNQNVDARGGPLQSHSTRTVPSRAVSEALLRSQSRALLSNVGVPPTNPQQDSTVLSIPPPATSFTPSYRHSSQQSVPSSVSASLLNDSPSAMPWRHRAGVSPGHSVHSHSTSTGLPTPSSERRRPAAQSRSRRTISSRRVASDPTGSDDVSSLRNRSTVASESGRRGSINAMADGVLLRESQIGRVAGPNKMVASRTTIQSLQSVNTDELPDNERTCIICYNDYGVETPEGLNEAPLRLPKCKHVFGDHCIKKWLEDSDSCPYCRDKLPSEPKQQGSATRVFMNLMRMRGAPMTPGMPAEMYLRLVENTISDVADGRVETNARPPTRRAAPSGSPEPVRRTRARRTHYSSRSPVAPSSDLRNRGQALAGLPSLASGSLSVAALSHRNHREQWTATNPRQNDSPPMSPQRHPRMALPQTARNRQSAASLIPGFSPYVDLPASEPPSSYAPNLNDSRSY